MLSSRDFTKQVSIIKAALSQSAALARHAGYPQVDFKILTQRMTTLDAAISRQHFGDVTKAMDAINGGERGCPATVDTARVPLSSSLPETKSRPVARSPEGDPHTIKIKLRELRVKAGKLGGHSTSRAKQRAARLNGIAGGRPKGAHK